MRLCATCNQVYNDESFFFCLNDGSPLSDLDQSQETLALPGMDSVVTVVRRGGIHPNAEFKRKYLYKETATDDLQIKIISSDEEDVSLGFKIAVENLSTGNRSVYVALKALDSDGFEIDEVALGGATLRSGEIRTFTKKEDYSAEIF